MYSTSRRDFKLRALVEQVSAKRGEGHDEGRATRTVRVSLLLDIVLFYHNVLLLFVVGCAARVWTYRSRDHHHHQCSAQRQVLHCKRRNLGCSSVEGRSSTANSENKATVLLGI